MNRIEQKGAFLNSVASVIGKIEKAAPADLKEKGFMTIACDGKTESSSLISFGDLGELAFAAGAIFALNEKGQKLFHDILMSWTLRVGPEKAAAYFETIKRDVEDVINA